MCMLRINIFFLCECLMVNINTFFLYFVVYT